MGLLQSKKFKAPDLPNVEEIWAVLIWLWLFSHSKDDKLQGIRKQNWKQHDSN